jgi:hypothetical protein
LDLLDAEEFVELISTIWEASVLMAVAFLDTFLMVSEDVFAIRVRIYLASALDTSSSQEVYA